MANRNRKLQVFVSSTFIDLQEERQAAVQAILNAGHIPAGMELFTAGDESQWTIIKRWIEESDVYMLLLGGRYGSIEPKSGKSYTHLEYEYAVKLKKPLFSVVISKDGLRDKIKREDLKEKGIEVTEIDNRDKLKKFQDYVGGHNRLIAPWSDHKDITIAVGNCIGDIEWRYRDSLKGWVKADDTDFSSISEELARLSKENSELKERLGSLTVEEKINGLPISEFVNFLKNEKIIIDGKLFTLSFRRVGKYIKYEVDNVLDVFWIICSDPAAADISFFSHAINDLKRYELLDSKAFQNLKSSGAKLFTYLKNHETLYFKEREC